MYFSSHSKPQTSTEEVLTEIRDHLKVANVLLSSGLNVPDELEDILTDVQNEPSAS